MSALCQKRTFPVRRTRSIHLFDVVELPTLVEPRLQWTIETEDHELRRFGSAHRYSAYVRPSHLLQGCFYTSPRFSFFRFTLLLEVSSLLSSLNDCHLAMGLKQLSGIVMDVDLTHPHDGVLLSLENKLTHTHNDQHVYSGFRFHGANTAIYSEISLLIRQQDRRV